MNKNGEKDQFSALQIAWERQDELSKNADLAQKLHLNLRRWVIILSVMATLLAVLSDLTSGIFAPLAPIEEWIRIFLILVPIIGSVILAFANKFRQGERWLILRAGAEEIKKDIFFHRTLLQQQPDRDKWLNEKVAAVQRRVLEESAGDLVLKPLASIEKATQESNLDDLLPAGYLQRRLENQLTWHENKVVALERQRIWYQVLIFTFGGLGTLLAAFGGVFQIWVALTASLAAAFTAWLELRQYDSVITNYNRLILELKIIRDHWLSLAPIDRTGDEFFKMVLATERVLWSQHQEYVSEMRQAVAELRGEAPDTLDEIAKMPAPAAIDHAILQQAEESISTAAEVAAQTAPEEIGEETDQSFELTVEKGAPHAFVVMPFGRKKGPDGRWIDFDSVYWQLIRPALIEAGFEPFRADEETVSGDILTDMFQELLLADLVIADLSIDNANAFYELGVRHALRKRGVVHIQSGRAYMPFDIFNVRTIPYQTGENGKPDPKHLANDIQTIAKVTRDTWASSHERVHSPIFNLLDGLPEPDRKALQTPLATGYWREYQTWQERVNIARRKNQIGDVLLLTEEVRNPLIQEEAISEAAKILSGLAFHVLALKQYRRGLEISPKKIEFRRGEAFELGRLKRRDEAVVKLEGLLQEIPDDSETLAFLGRLYKDMWVDSWQQIDPVPARLQEAYNAIFLLKKSIDTYLIAYRLDQNHYYSGINALTLSMLLDHLDRTVGDEAHVDPDLEAIRQQSRSLAGAVQFSLEQTAKHKVNDFWVFASLGDAAVLVATTPREVTRAYRKALALGSKSKYAVRSVLGQLRLLEALAFRPEFVEAGIAVLEHGLAGMTEVELADRDQLDYDPAQTFLCAGHMIDRPDRPEPRFPPDMEPEAREKIEQTLDELQANENDLLIIPGLACGADILFAEACLGRGMNIEVYLPFVEEKFIQTSVRFAGDQWVERFYEVRQDPRVTVHLQPERLGPTPEGENDYARNTRWALYSALAYGIDRIRLIALWDGKGGDGPGGTGYVVKEVRQLGGVVKHLNTTKFNYWRQEAQT